MKKLLATLLVGAMLGLIASYHLLPSASESRFSKVLEHDIQSVPHISAEEARLHREDRYESIRTIEDTLALPTDFAVTEALYVVAGRADSGEVQNLIYQAARVRDQSDRTAALEILFLRLTELDPLTALAITRTPAFANNRMHEGSVWTAWGKLDLDAALEAALDGDARQKNLAAQSLYMSLQNLDTEDAERIRSVLGMYPGRIVRTQQLHAMAKASPVDAVRYIESSGTPTEQSKRFAMLALYLLQSGRGIDSNFAELIQSKAHRELFEQVSATFGMQGDPASALKNALAEPTNEQSQMRIYSALQQLASQDPQVALEYLGQLPNAKTQQSKMMATMVINTVANSDPQKALAWVRQNRTPGNQEFLVNTLATIAKNDPQLAISEVQMIENNALRDRVYSRAVMMTAYANPKHATILLDQITSATTRRSSIDQLASNWAQSDFDGAVEWVSTLENRDQRRAFEKMGQRLVHTDIDRAVELLDKIPASNSGRLQKQIAQNLARQQSIGAALSFIDRYKGTDEYQKLRMTVISSAAATDPAQAIQMARSVEDPRARDRVLGSIAGQKATHDPQLALQWRKSIVSEELRSKTTAQIARNWYSQDTVAASTWLNGLPRGAERDNAIAAIVTRSGNSATEADALIDSISDAEKRRKTIIVQIRSLAKVDSTEAEHRLSRVELSDSDRKKLQKVIDNARYKY